MNDLIFRTLLPPNSCFLLDLENQGFNAKLEAIVDRAAKYPLSTKIAFANFANRSQVSAELHRRMYSMVHVPKVTNAADAQMITTGCLLFLNNPQTKAVKINRLGSKFAQIYGNGINYFLNKFELGIKFIDFIKLNPQLTIIKQDKEYYVCLSHFESYQLKTTV
jgi:hypothetical protein